MNRLVSRSLLAPSVVVLFLWMVVPLGMTVYFSFIRYNLLQPDKTGYLGWLNYDFFVTDPAFLTAIGNTTILLGSVVVISCVGGFFLALLIQRNFPGRFIVRLLLLAPFFIMPTVNALLWKHLMMHPIYGVLAQVATFFGFAPIDWLTDLPLFSIIIMSAWQWLPFATLIFITSLQSMDEAQLEAAQLDGATYLQQVRYFYFPHLKRPISVVCMIEVIFLISLFAEIFITTAGGPGNASLNLAFLIFKQALLNFDVGVASAGALFAILFANIVAVFLIRLVGKNLA